MRRLTNRHISQCAGDSLAGAISVPNNRRQRPWEPRYVHSMRAHDSNETPKRHVRAMRHARKKYLHFISGNYWHCQKFQYNQHRVGSESCRIDILRSLAGCRKMPVKQVFTTRSSYASAVLGIVILSVCLSVTRVLCDETIEQTADILISHERVIILVIRFRRRLVGDVPFHLKFALKLTHPIWKALILTNICL